MRTKEELLDLIDLFKRKYLEEFGVPHKKEDISKVLSEILEERNRKIVIRMLGHLKDNDFFNLSQLFFNDAKREVSEQVDVKNTPTKKTKATT